MFFIKRFLLIIALILQYQLWLGNHGINQMLLTKREINRQFSENEGLLNRNRVLQQKITDFKRDPGAIEKFARKELGMIRQGETFYYMPNQNNDDATVELNE